MSGAGKHDWELPGTYEVVPGVHRIPLPLPNDALRAVNVYAVSDGDELVMIDSGWALEESRQQLEAALGTLDADLASISRFLVTHAHRDHYSQAVAVRKLLGTRVCLGAEEHHTLDALQLDPAQFPSQLLERLLQADAQTLVNDLRLGQEGLEPVDPSDWPLPDDWLVDGQQILVGSRRLEVIATPGHTRGHVVFLEAEAGILFAGDHVLPHITPSIGFESAPADSPLSQYLGSLRRIGLLQDSLLLPAHGPVGGSVNARVKELLAHHDDRLGEAYAAVVSGASTGYSVAKRLRWTSRRTAFEDLHLFNRMIAVNETIAHLDVLVETGRLVEELVDSVRHYEVAVPTPSLA